MSRTVGENKFAQTFSQKLLEELDFWKTRINENQTWAFQCSPETNQQTVLLEIPRSPK
jgi:hypothetical protein